MESGNVGASSLSCCSPLGSDNHGVPFHACKAPRSLGYPGEYRSGRNKNKMGTEHVFHDKLIYSISLLIPRGIITLHVVFRSKSNLALRIILVMKLGNRHEAGHSWSCLLPGFMTNSTI